MAGCMEGVRVVELGHWVVVPSATAILADWGADVIKIEDPGVGDAIRGVRSIEGMLMAPQGVYPGFEVLNRNKRGVAINLRHERGREILYKLIEISDAFVSNFQPSVLARYCLDYQTLSNRNPRLVYGVLTGYGDNGPDKDKPGYDYSAFWARSGIMDKISDPDGPPRPQRPGFGDNITSLCVVSGLVGALYARERTGRGQEVSFSLLNTAVWTLNQDISVALYLGQEIPKTTRTTARNPLWNNYLTKDRRWIQLVMVQSDRFWSRFCKVMGLSHLEQDPLYKTSIEREQNFESLIKILDDVFATKTLVEWEELFEKNEIVSSRVQTVLEVTEDPQAIANEFWVEIEHPAVGRLKTVASPVKFKGTPASVRRPAPDLGQHTEEVLLELGYTWDDIANLKDLGAIG